MSLGFRCGDWAYSNDVVRMPEETLAALTGLDVWIVDALRDTPHPTHASVSQALAWAERLSPARTILTNLHVDLDYEALRRRLPENVEPAFDGLSFSTLR
jgi:phosphoribosyl 1,2-cyclic phosphate phosphodiesterase